MVVCITPIMSHPWYSFPSAIGHGVWSNMPWECYFDNKRNQIVVMKRPKRTHEIKVDNIYQMKLENKVISPTVS